MYTIKYHTGVQDDTADTIEEAMQTGDKHAAYTQQPITIHDETGKELYRRPWWGTKYDSEEDPDTVNPIPFCGSGYYGDWQDGMEDYQYDL